jgi:restriction system protein
MNLGDIVLVPNTREGKTYVGIIDSEYFYKKNADENCPYSHRRKVKWLKILNYSEFSQKLKNTLGSIMTTFSISDHSEEIERFLLGSGSGGEIIENYSEFGLESHLEDFLIENWRKLGPGTKYNIIKEDDQIVSQQYVTPIGRIDILARAKNNSGWLIIELKKGKSDDQVVGQILRYIGWVKENLTEKGEDVRGLIITKEKDEKLMYALKTLGNVNLMTYSVKFNLKEER